MLGGKATCISFAIAIRSISNGRVEGRRAGRKKGGKKES